MNFISNSDPALATTFGEALLASLAPDGGLWMPARLPHFTPEETARLGAMSFADCAAELAIHFVGDAMSEAEVREICRDAYDFPMPLVSLGGEPFDAAMTEDADHYFLELFHGPTLAFKDFAARFMGRAVGNLLAKNGERRTILVATSGDTGGAIGYAFEGQPNVDVLILYPEGGVSAVQEQQLTTISAEGGNIRAVRVTGTFDDCQALVKQAFADDILRERHNLMSANSINVGRVVPQSFYYVWSSLQLAAGHPGRPIVYSIPSGNLGNITGGLMAKLMGAPIDRFVVGHNANDPFVDYLTKAKYTPRDSVPTLSNAMDIGRPSNFARILSLFDGDHAAISDAVWGASFSDQDTERHLRRVHSMTGYIMCPHTTVGHLAMQAYLREDARELTQVTVATAHPAKFQDDVERIIRDDVPLPPSLARIMSLAPHVVEMKPTLDALKALL